MENFSPIFVDDSECDDRSNDQYIMNGQKKQSHNCGLSGRASGGPLFYPIAQLRHVDLLCNLSLPLYIYILLFLCAISHRKDFFF